MFHNSTAERPFPLLEPKEIQVYKNDLVVKYRGVRRADTDDSYVNESVRGDVVKFSDKSLRRLAFVASNTSVDFDVMVTLTYPGEFPTDGKRVKANLNAWLTWLRGEFDGVSYLWFLEFQKRGAPHFHVLIANGFKVSGDIKRDVSERWYRIVGSGDERHLVAGTRVEKVREKDGARRYAVKYAQKAEQKTVPDEYRSVGRFWGHSRDVKPEAIGSIGVDSRDGVKAIVGDWEYKDVIDGRNVSVLYNAAEKLDRYAVGVMVPTYADMVRAERGEGGK